jgi:isoquinoline 1-oxidoreductase alpha subunit
VQLQINEKSVDLDVEADMPLLWVLRDLLDMTGTKFGCGMGLCGACTVHIDGSPVRACITPVGTLAGKRIATIEAVESDHPVQQAWLELNVVQCGYCQPGQIMSAVALLANNPEGIDDDLIDSAMAGNICRCGTYPRIRAALKRAAELTREPTPASGTS